MLYAVAVCAAAVLSHLAQCLVDEVEGLGSRLRRGLGGLSGAHCCERKEEGKENERRGGRELCELCD